MPGKDFLENKGDNMAEILHTLAEIRQVNSSFPYTLPIKEWKDQGKKVIGWSCNYVPEEIIHAADMLPIRVTGKAEPVELSEATGYMYTTSCTPMRSCLQLGLNNEYSFLDGFVTGSACDQSRRLFDIWIRYIQTPFTHILGIPSKLSDRGYKLYRKEVLEFKRELESFFQVQITPQALRDSIALFNKTRELLKGIYELRKSDSPPITGAETLEVLNASMKMPKEGINLLLEKLLQEAASIRRPTDRKIRLMVHGSMLNNPGFIKFIEDQGCIIVVDELCTGIRYLSDPIDASPELDPLEAISRRYFYRFPCPRTFAHEIRFNRILDLVKEYKVHGVIAEIVRYCAPLAWDLPMLSERLKHQGIPLLRLNLEYGTGESGPIKTRVQAFLETLEGRVEE